MALPSMSAAATPAASPIEVVGTVSLLVALLIAAWCVGAGIAGNARHNRRLVLSAVYGLYAFFALVAVASALLIYGFITHDYAIKYVALNSDTSMSLSYKITAFWGGLDGSLLFWVLVLAAFSALAVRVNQNRHRDMIGYVAATIMVVQLFFLLLLVYVKNPFATFMTAPPADGQGLNPLLQNYWMVIHPPALYVGYVAATIPFAFGVGALASGRLDDLWLGSVRVWMLICFLFLSLGLILGGRWAYEELGWGGYWAWDPVENAGLFPWFTATAFLHSAIIQEQRGMMKRWNLMLVIVTFLLTIFGTFMTRSGIVESVHAFGKDNELALYFVVFMTVVTVIAFGLLIHRAPKLRSQNQFESFTSREFAFLLNNWILLGCAFFVLFATMFATISEAFAGRRVTVGIPFFNKFMVPLGLILLLLAGAAPLLAWRRSTRERLARQFLIPTAAMVVTILALFVLVPDSRILTPIFHAKVQLPVQLTCFGFVAFTVASIVQEYVQGIRVRMKQTGSDPFTSLVGMALAKRRKYGGYIVHLGVAVMFLGFAGKAWDTTKTFTVPAPTAMGVPEERAEFHLHGYRFVYKDLIQEADENKHATTAVVTVYAPNGDRLADLRAAKWRFFKGEQQTTTEVAIHPRLGEDVYLVLDHYEADSRLAVFVVFLNPLINWVWVGFVIFAFGTLVCLIPQRVVDHLSARPRTRLGRAADVAGLIFLVGVAIGAPVRAAYAQGGPPPGMEHEDRTAGPRGHDDGAGYYHRHRPEEIADPEARRVATRLMKDLVCLCGGCQRESLHDCKCGYAAKQREIVLSLLAGKDLSSSAGRSAAYDDVVAAFMQRYGGGHVLTEPRDQLSWIFPYVAIAGGLGLLLLVVARWKRRAAAEAPPPPPPVDDEYAEKLDDELREID
jgi:cytochrome c-type biogenesis protein CcmF